MSDEQRRSFKDELLESSIQDRMRCFDDVLVGHKHISGARSSLLSAISEGPRDSLIFVFGPTGVGKSTLRDSVARDICNQFSDEMITDRALIPVVSIEVPAPAPAAGFFSWPDTFHELLVGLQEPLIDFKILPPSVELDFRFPAYQRHSIARFRYAYKRAIEHRRPRAVLLDDAHYMSKVPGSRLLYSLDFVKSLASYTQVPHVLLGTYELLALRNLSGQIARRSIDVHFRCYRFTKDDTIAFTRAVKSLEVKMPVRQCPDLVAHAEYLMERSAGCIGLLKTWLNRALMSAMQKSDITVDRSHLEETTYSDEALSRIFLEISEGEARIENNSRQYKMAFAEFRNPSDISNANLETLDPGTHNKRKPGAPRPFTRNPKRDPIGERSAASPQT